MKKLLFFLIVTTASGTLSITEAQGGKKKNDSTITKTEAKDSITSKKNTDTTKGSKEGESRTKKDGDNAAASAGATNVNSDMSKIVVTGFFVVMIILLYYFFRHIKTQQQRIGFQSIKLIGLILIFPGICILAIAGGKDILAGQTLAVLLGTIAGYVLSRDDEPKDNTPKDPNNFKNENQKKLDDQAAKIKALEDELKNIKDKNSDLKT